MNWSNVAWGGGAFDMGPEPQNRRGWELYELGQRRFWDVPGAVAWDAPVDEDPEYRDAIGAMLGFLAPGEKAAVTGATLISLKVPTEEAKFYFVEQALEESKHYDALRRIIPRITGRPLAPPPRSVRLLYSFGVVDPNDVAFMMGNINIVGEHLANHIFQKIRPVARSETLRELLRLISQDESRHVAAGRRFYGDVHKQYRRNHKKILVKNAAVMLLLALAGHDLVQPMARIGVNLEEIAMQMYDHYADVVGGLPPFPEQGLIEALVGGAGRHTRATLRVIAAITDADGNLRTDRLLAACEHAIRSPRALRALFS